MTTAWSILEPINTPRNRELRVRFFGGSTIRKSWGLPKHKELWFRGESRDYGDTILRPELYRPPADSGIAIKPIEKLLSIENDLYEEFQRVAVERSDEKTSDEDWPWDSYFLMQHHNGPTSIGQMAR